MKQSTIIKNHNSLEDILIGLGITLVLALFCYYAHFSLIIPLLLLFLGLHLGYFKKASLQLFLQLGLLLTLLIFTLYMFTKYYTHVPVAYVPVACIGILTILLFNDLQLAFIVSFLASVLAGLITSNGLTFSLIFFIGSLSGVYMVKDARTRGRLITTGLFVGFMQVLTAILLEPEIIFLSFASAPHNLPEIFQAIAQAGAYLKPIFLSGLIAAFVVIATLKIFELLFGVVTNFSLLELSDFNQPLLRRLLLEAPGTYQHSLVVSNIAESAADAVGANGLLTRVGGYYHDVGKLTKPEYFAENQYAESKHEHIEPTISRLIILNHVKDGIDIAKKYKLSPHIIDFIPQHHGTSVIYYFYQRALEDAGIDETVSQENFRYAGPKPQSRETAILLLADSVEGAVRALDDSSPARIEEVVRKVINNKFIDGQLDECDLTLKNIETISATFTRVLSAMYHTRIKYPEKKNGNGHHNKKSSETNPNLSQPREADPDGRSGA